MISAFLTALAYASAFAFLISDPQTPPNYYPGLVSAREASKNTQKEMIIFFSDKKCATCEGAWIAFTKDTRATEKYISTRMDIGDFDGGIFFDLLDLNQVPSWIILSPEGTEKERWEGGWKDENGKPTKFDAGIVQTPAKEEKKKDAVLKTPTSIVKTSKTVNSTEDDPASPTHGFFIQAGFFGSEANAQKMLGDMRSKGITGYKIKSVEQNGGMFYRVMSGIFETESDTNQEQQRMKGAGFTTSVKIL